VLPLNVLAQALEPLVEARLVKDDMAVDGQAGAAFLFVDVVRRIAATDGVGEAGAKGISDASRVDISALLPADKKNDAAALSLMTAAGVTFLDPKLAESVREKEAANAAQAFTKQLDALSAYLRSGVLAYSESEGTGPTEAIAWLDANFPQAAQADAKVARVVMSCVLETAAAGDESADRPLAPKLCKQIERCAKLLKKCTADEKEPRSLTKQAGCLFEVQAFCHKLQWPQGLIKKVFYQMYETDVVFEDAFGVWREDLTDETPGKDKALIQVNEFLQWLDEAAEEEDGENDD
jgi:hypothetical protein